MQLISKFNKGIRFLLCAIDVFSKYASLFPLKDKKGVTIVNAFQNILNSSKRKPNKIWLDKGIEFYIKTMKSWLEKNNIDIYSTHDEGKSVLSKKLIRTLKNKIYKQMTSISQNIYVDKFNDIVNEYNNKYHRTIKMKPIDVKDNTHIDSIKEVNDKDPKIKLVIMSKFQNAESFLINDIL